ncbi:putative head morphogenesis protein [Aminobacter phage Erebus]|nr:putative head morphogenesis protein [Aminobacter phage Erebus]
MLRYDIGELAVRKTGVGFLPQLHGLPATEAQYLAILRAMLRALNKAVRLDVVPVAEVEMAAQRRITRDVDAGLFERILNLGRALGNIASSTVGNVLVLASQRHTAAFLRTAKSALGIDLSAVVRQDDLATYLELAATRNAGLIKGLSELVVGRVQQTVMTAVLNGIPAKDLRVQLANDFGFADARAKLIARDQTAKLTSDLNRFRHTQAGITHYVWRTSQDERVRPRHRHLDGLAYEYGKPTGAENGLPPGQPIQCRCIAQAIVNFGDTPLAITNGQRYIAVEATALPKSPPRARRRRLR